MRAAARARCASRVVLVLSCAFVVGLAPARDAARAQEKPADHGGRSFQVGDSDELRSQVDEFRRQSKAGDWELAVETLQRILDVPSDAGLVVQVESGALPRWNGAHVVARELFDGLPEAGLAAWEKTYRGRAEALLGRALESRDDALLAEAARRFPVLDVRLRADEGRARIAFASGEPARAVAPLERLRAAAPTDAARASLTSRIAFALSQTADRAGVDRELALLGALADEPVQVGESAEPLRTFVERMARQAGPAPVSGGSWPSFGGSVDGLVPAQDTPPSPVSPAWSISTRFEEGSSTYADSRSYSGYGHRPTVPVLVRNVLYVNNGLEVRAHDVSSGRAIWAHRTVQRHADWRDNRHYVHSAAVADGVVYAAPATRSDAPSMKRVFYSREIVYKLPHRALHALDAHTGEVLWAHDADSLAQTEHPDSARISQESVASPPLVVGDDVLVSTWRWQSMFEVAVVCFDRHTGRTRWRRQVAGGQQELNLFGRPVKELATSSLVARDGRVYLATALGVAACLELASGDVVWAAAYPQTELPQSDFWYQTAERPVTWHPAPAVLTHDAFVVAPTESSYLTAFDRRTGKVSWMLAAESGVSRGNRFIGVTGGRAYVSGSTIRAVDAKNGKQVMHGPPRLRTPANERATLEGRGVVTRKDVLVPSTAGTLRFDARSGELREVVGRGRGEGPSAHDLVLVGDVLLEIGQDEIRGYYDSDARRRGVLTRLAARPDDPQLRLEAGEVFRRAGDLDDAVSSLEIGLRNVGEMASAAKKRIEAPLRRALYETYIERGKARREKADAPGAVEDFVDASRVTDDPQSVVMALFLVAHAGAGPQRRAAYERLAGEFGDFETTFPNGSRRHAGAYAAFMLGEELAARGELDRALGTWMEVMERHGDRDHGDSDVRSAVQARLERLAKRHGAKVRAAVDARAASRFERAQAQGDAAALDDVVRLYPKADVASDAAHLAARLHVAAGDTRRATVSLKRFLGTGPSAQRAARALLSLAETYGAAGDLAAERRTLERAVREHGEVVVEGSTVTDRTRERLAAPELARIRMDLPRPRPPLGLLWQAKGRRDVPTTLRVAGDPPDGLGGRILATGPGALLALSAQSGDVVWSAPLGSEVNGAAISGGDSIVVVGSVRRADPATVTIEAFDAETGTPTWSRRLGGRYRLHEPGDGVVYVMRAVSDADGTHYVLAVVDLSSGEVLATRTLPRPVNDSIVVAENAVVAFRTDLDRGKQTRIAVVMDATTLALRGRLRLAVGRQRVGAVATQSPGVVVALGGDASIVGVGTRDASELWALRIRDGIVTLLPTSAGVAVIDKKNVVHGVDVDSGEIAWSTPLTALGSYPRGGAAAKDGDLVVPVVRSRTNVTVVSLDPATGEKRFAREFPLASRAAPRVVVAQDVLALEVPESVRGGTYRTRVEFLNRKDGRVVGRLPADDLPPTYVGLRYDREFVTAMSISAAGQHLLVFGSDSESR